MSRFSNDPLGPTVEALMVRPRRGLTYRGLAAKTGLSAGYLNHIVHGNRPVPSQDVLCRIAFAFGVGPDYFLEWRLRVLNDRLKGDPELVNRLYRKFTNGGA